MALEELGSALRTLDRLQVEAGDERSARVRDERRETYIVSKCGNLSIEKSKEEWDIVEWSLDMESLEKLLTDSYI